MKTAKNFYTIHRSFISLMTFSLLVGLVFMFTNNLDFIVEAMNQGKFNFSNAAYSMSKVVIGIMIPIAFIVPSRNEMGRIRTGKLLFIIYGILNILMFSWIFPYMASGSGDMVAFQSDIENSYVTSYILWDSYYFICSIYSLLYGALCIYIGISLDDNKKKVCSLLLVLPIMRLLLPIITNLVTGNGVLSVLWITNNYADLLSLIAINIAFYFAASYDITWINLIWNQEIENNTYDEIEGL